MAHAILNRVFICIRFYGKPYEHCFGKNSIIKNLRVFSCNVNIPNYKDHLSKFSSKVNEDILIGYLSSSKVYMVCNKRSVKVEESSNVVYSKTTNVI